MAILTIGLPIAGNQGLLLEVEATRVYPVVAMENSKMAGRHPRGLTGTR